MDSNSIKVLILAIIILFLIGVGLMILEKRDCQKRGQEQEVKTRWNRGCFYLDDEEEWRALK